MRNYFRIGALLTLLSLTSAANAIEYPAVSVQASSALPTWPVTQLKDGSIDLAWSSTASLSPLNNQEWVVYDIGTLQPVNFVKIWARKWTDTQHFSQSQNQIVTLGFPEDFEIEYSQGSGWYPVRQFTAFPVPHSSAPVTLGLGSTVYATKVRVKMTKLRTDNDAVVGGDGIVRYYAQLAELTVGYVASAPPGPNDTVSIYGDSTTFGSRWFVLPGDVNLPNGLLGRLERPMAAQLGIRDYSVPGMSSIALMNGGEGFPKALGQWIGKTYLYGADVKLKPFALQLAQDPANYIVLRVGLVDAITGHGTGAGGSGETPAQYTTARADYRAALTYMVGEIRNKGKQPIIAGLNMINNRSGTYALEQRRNDFNADAQSVAQLLAVPFISVDNASFCRVPGLCLSDIVDDVHATQAYNDRVTAEIRAGLLAQGIKFWPQ